MDLACSNYYCDALRVVSVSLLPSTFINCDKRFVPSPSFIYHSLMLVGYNGYLFYSLGYNPILSSFILLLKFFQLCSWEFFKAGFCTLLTCCFKYLLKVPSSTTRYPTLEQTTSSRGPGSFY